MFKTFDPARDIKPQVSSINEVLTFDGALFTGTHAGEQNVKKHQHWISGTVSGSLYQSIYNTIFTASTAVELLNITYGQSISSSNYQNPAATNKVEKNKMYRLHAKMLLGDESQRFNIGGRDVDECIFVHLKRSQMKDELKKGSLSIVSIASGTYTNVQNVVFSSTLSDAGAESRYKSTARGDVGEILNDSLEVAGHVYYQAGVVVLDPGLFSLTGGAGNFWSGSMSYESLAVSGGADGLEDMLTAIRYRFRGMTVINQTNLQSTYYFCRALNDEFNYSSNPTFLDSSQRIVPTSGSNNLQTRTYITKVGLLGENQELLAVAAVGKPLLKSPDTELVIKVRLDN